jgi:hypothetical protein
VINKTVVIAACVGAAAFALGCTVTQIYVNPPKSLGDAATWAGACGTFLAFIGTIWIAVSESKRRELERMNRAMLTSAGMLPRLTDFMSMTDVLEAELSATSDLDDFEYVGRAAKLEQACTWTLEEVLPLVALPNNAAYELEFARAKVVFCVNTLKSAVFNKSTYNPETSSVIYDVEEVRKAKLDAANGLAEARTSVRIAIRECGRILPRRRPGS